MKRVLLMIISILLILATAACGSKPAAETTPEATPTPEPVETQTGVAAATDSDYLLDLDESGSILRETGSPLAAVNYNGTFNAIVNYPVTGSAAPDAELQTLAENQIASAVSEYAQNGANAANLTVNYNTFKLDDRYISVKEAGWYVDSTMSTYRDIVYTANIDLTDGKTLGVNDILKAGWQEILFPLAQTQAASSTPDDSWFANLLLTSDALRTVIPAGTAGFTETTELSFPYADIKDALAIESEKFAAASSGDGTVDPAKPMVALTFDDGPSKNTAKILDLLKANNGHATFFVVGNRLDEYSETLTRAASEGNEIGNHTWAHTKLTNISQSEIGSELDQTTEKVKELTGNDIKVMRPPGGSTNDDVKAVCSSKDLLIALWQIDTLDWKTKDPDQTYKAIMDDVQSGDIILCHDLYEATATAMERVIPALAEKYQLVTVSQLLTYQEGGAHAGVVYHNNR